MLSASEKESILRWAPGTPRGHVESTFLKLNVPGQKVAFWLKFTVLQPIPGAGEPKGEVWGIFFDSAHPEGNVAVKESFPISELTYQYDRFFLRFGKNEIARGRTNGSLGEGTHRAIAWDLTFTTGEKAFRHFPYQRMYELPFPKTKAVSPHIDARFKGTVTVNGRAFEVHEAPGMHGHNWGERHAEEWVWAHCNAFEEPGVVFEGLSGRVALGPLNTPMLTILHLRTPEHRVTFNRLRDLLATASRLHGLYWSFEAKDGPYRLRGVVHGRPDVFVGVNYYDPDGTVHHCLNSKVAALELHLARRNGAVWDQVGSYRTQATCAFEIGTKGDTHGVRIHIP